MPTDLSPVASRKTSYLLSALSSVWWCSGHLIDLSPAVWQSKCSCYCIGAVSLVIAVQQELRILFISGHSACACVYFVLVHAIDFAILLYFVV